MRARKRLLMQAASLAESGHCQPRGFSWCQSTRRYHAFLLLIDLYNHFGEVWHTRVASHTRWFFFFRVAVRLLSLQKALREPLSPYLLILSCGERLEHPAELLLVVGEKNGWPLCFAAR